MSDNNRNLIVWIVIAAIFTITVGAILFMFNSNANAGGNKVRICHATASDTNPYVNIEIDASSIENPNDKKYLNGHGDHEKDIIPPFTFGESEFLGKNWDDTGQMIWNNDCKVVVPEPTPTPTPTEPTPTPTEPTPTPTPTEPTPNPTEPTPTPTEPNPVPTDIPAGGGGMAVKVPALK